MSAIKTKKNGRPGKAKQHTSPEQSGTSRMKRKSWMKDKFQRIKPPPKVKEKAKPQEFSPPEDAQLYSANWKSLQEVLKASEPEKKTVTPKQNGAFQKKDAKDISSKNLSKSNVHHQKTDTGAKVKHKTVPNSVSSKDSGVSPKVPAVSETEKSVAPKRKKGSGRSDHEQASKKKKEDKPVVEDTKPTKEDLWFDDVDPDDIEATLGAEAAEIMRQKQGIQKSKDPESSLVKERAFEGLTRAVAIDCEMVGVGLDGEDSILARVSLVNQFGKCIYDKFVKPTETVTDYRTAVSGIRPENIKDGEDVRTVQREVAEILQGRIVVGHAIHNDLKILLLDHPKKKIRDTQKYKPFRRTVRSNRPALRVLCREILNVKVQQGEHSSVQDAQATMRLYTLVKKQWEAEIKARQNNKGLNKKSERKPRFPKNKDKRLTGNKTTDR